MRDRRTESDRVSDFVGWRLHFGSHALCLGGVLFFFGLMPGTLFYTLWFLSFLLLHNWVLVKESKFCLRWKINWNRLCRRASWIFVLSLVFWNYLGQGQRLDAFHDTFCT